MRLPDVLNKRQPGVWKLTHSGAFFSHIPAGSCGSHAAGRAQSPEDWPLPSFWEMSSEPLESSAWSRVLHAWGLGWLGRFMLTTWGMGNTCFCSGGRRTTVVAGTLCVYVTGPQDTPRAQGSGQPPPDNPWHVPSHVAAESTKHICVTPQGGDTWGLLPGSSWTPPCGLLSSDFNL